MAQPRGQKRKAPVEERVQDADSDVEAQDRRVSHPRKGLAPRKNGVAATAKDKKEKDVNPPPKMSAREAAAAKKAETAAKKAEAAAKKTEAAAKKAEAAKKAKAAKVTKQKSSPLSRKKTSAAAAAAVTTATPAEADSQESQSSQKTDELSARPTKRARARGPTLNHTIPRPDVVGNIYVFGKGEMAELGLGPAANARIVKRPRLNHFLLPEKVGVVQVACGGMHSLVLTKDGKVYSWGVNDQGALGRDTQWEAPVKDADASDSEDEDTTVNPKESTPGLVEGFPNKINIVQVAAGDSISVALTEDGYVYAWGTFRVSHFYCVAHQN